MNIDKGNDLQKEELDIFNNYRGRWGGYLDISVL